MIHLDFLPQNSARKSESFSSFQECELSVGKGFQYSTNHHSGLGRTVGEFSHLIMLEIIWYYILLVVYCYQPLFYLFRKGNCLFEKISTNNHSGEKLSHLSMLEGVWFYIPLVGYCYLFPSENSYILLHPCNFLHVFCLIMTYFCNIAKFEFSES